MLVLLFTPLTMREIFVFGNQQSVIRKRRDKLQVLLIVEEQFVIMPLIYVIIFDIFHKSVSNAFVDIRKIRKL